ncbi:hypothetical protein HUO14_14105 [Parasphingorhabdus flavimaris]|jgi:hypothetical protein|uniref:Polysaccharide biosynthesis protein n=1 Tax=Parasphingorhabdus flavimaris TaxID=266812 RepID=A0ABX2N5R9_9SPHN|nr:hypothetical protein [Parasphingorhabdus flavimaris]NVD29029.1 hypothetical protein [Parasphingorhabdus flavimaris]
MLIRQTLPFVTRAAAAVFALFSIKLTYDFLSAQDFALLNYILFILAMSTALSSPINRLFWAENSRDNFVVAVYSTCTVFAFLTILLLTAYGFANTLERSTFLLVGCFSIAYGMYKVAERYIYGQIMFDRSLNAALAIPALFALLELLFVTFQYWTGLPSLSARLLGPALLAVGVAFAIPAFRPYSMSLVRSLRHYKNSISVMIKQIFSPKGGKMLILTIATTLAVMIDRLILGYYPIKNPAASADYLLALSYAIAIQTFLNVLIDLGRKRIYQNMAWVGGAKSFAQRVFLLAVPLALSLILIFPALHYLVLIPASVNIYVWVVLILRAITSFIINFAFTDSIQSGRISDTFMPILILVTISLAFLFMLITGIEDRTAAIVCGVPLIALSLVVVAGFHRRVPADLT